MIITVNKVHEINKQTSTSNVIAANNQSIFKFEQQPPADSIITKRLWNDNTKSLLYDAIQNMGINNYTPSILKDDNTAIAKSQKHLIDLIKYYEGDRNYYYEAYTTPYKDKFGSTTSGFGELTNKYMTQEKAYENLCKKLKSYTNEVRNLLNKKLGKNTFENLPSSIKEGLIDLCYNKGLGAISQNADLINAVKNKDYSTVIAHLVCVYSGKTGAPKEEDAGLYKRSLNRAILASRDLKGQELEQAKQEIEKIYKKAIKCHENNKVSLNELNKIYEQFKTGKISAKSVSAESFKVKIDDRFKGKGAWAVAQALYKSLGESDTSFQDFYKEFIAINGNSTEIKIGQEVKVPYFKEEMQPSDSVKNVTKNVVTNVTNIAPDKNKKESEVEKPGFFKRAWRKIKHFFSKIGDFFRNLFGIKKKQKEVSTTEEPKTPFEKILKHGKIVQDGDFQIITMDYKVKKGDNLWNLSRTYGTSEEILCNDNNIEDKNNIKEGQILKIQKLGYKVQKGDNLYQIAKKFGLTVEILKDLNNIEDVNLIHVNQMLEIPGFIYTVKPKDTLYKISKQVGVSLEDLKKINGLASDTIRPNQKIKIVYNDSDFAVSSDKRKVCFDPKTNTKKEVIDMRGAADLSKRPLLQKKRKINGQVMATRQIFNPTKKGSLSGKTIIVNAGHGYSQAGTDCGALGIGNIEDEWLLNYDNAIRLKDRLCAKGAKVVFLQGHVNIMMKELRKKENKADLFISIHVNSYDKKTQDRTQIYTYNRNSVINKKSKKLSSIMEKNFDNWIQKNEKISNKDKFVIKDTITNSKGKKEEREIQDYAQSKEANYGVIRTAENEQKIPAVLWEVAFMISPKGRERLKNPSLMNNYSDIMAQSIEQYFRG